jgi:cellulose synthase/poly-beta-1,6-N-acetylglucosamine synthase-like glycosyltransferase
MSADLASSERRSESAKSPRLASGLGEIELSVVMPCLNERDTLETCIRKAQRAMVDAGIQGEVVVADNGSSDGSQAIAARAVPAW